MTFEVWNYYGRSTYREVFDLVLSWIVLTIAFSVRHIFAWEYQVIALYAVAVLLGFVFHELAHRLTANRYGFWARYRAWYPGLLITLLISFVSRGRIVFAAPGAVLVEAPWIGSRELAYISLSGPASNIAASAAFIGISALTSWSALRLIADVNAWLAFFNLLPIPPLDGYKAFRGSPTLWAVLFAFSAVLSFLVP